MLTFNKAFAVLSALAFLGLANAEYTDKCETASLAELTGDVLFAYCKDSNGNEVFNWQFYLRECIKNNDGVLAFAVNGNFASSCNNFALAADGVTFSADCAGPEASILHSEINLNDGIISVNSDGLFYC